MDIYKKLMKIFENVDPLPEEDDIAEPDVALEPEPESDVAPEAPEATEPMPAGGAVGPAKRERLDNDEQLKSWYGLPPAKPGRTFADLKGLVGPLTKGWTREEVISAMQPSIMDKARKYGTTPAYTVDDAVVDGMDAVNKALTADKSIAPFTTHAFRWLDTVMSREAAKLASMRNVTGQQTYGGKLDWRGKNNQAQSLDTPDEHGDTAAANLANKSADSDPRDAHLARVQNLVHKFLNNPNVGLSDTEKTVVMATVGMKADGSKREPIPTAEVARLLSTTGVPLSAARISQIRTSALDKIKDYVQFRGMKDIDSAEDKMGMNVEESIARALTAIIRESLSVEIMMLQKYQTIGIDAIIEGVEMGIGAVVDSETLEVVDVTDRFNESILAKVPSSSIDEVKMAAKYILSDKYYASITESIVESNYRSIKA